VVRPLGLAISAVKLGTPTAQVAATQTVAQGRLTTDSHWLIFVRRVTSYFSGLSECFFIMRQAVMTLVVLFSASPKSKIVLQCFSFLSV